MDGVGGRNGKGEEGERRTYVTVTVASVVVRIIVKSVVVTTTVESVVV